MPGLASVYVVGTVDTNQSITKGQFRTLTICRQAADIAWYPLYPFGHEYQAILFPNGRCVNLDLAVHASVMRKWARAASGHSGNAEKRHGKCCHGKWHF